MTLPAKLLGGFSGIMVDNYGYASFFVYAALLGIPAILLVSYLMFNTIRKDESSSSLQDVKT
jgi:PAT family beta-lactamase induction signal transducer AmpG